MEHTIRALRPEERMLAFLRDDRGMQESGYIGNLRVDMGTHGTDFFPVWDCFDEKLNGKAFQAEFGEVVNALRHDPSFNGILHDRKSMARLCQKVPDSRMSLNANEFGFRMDTADRTYILRLNPPRGRYAAHIYAYDRETLERYMEPILARRKEMKVLLVEPEKRPEVRQIGCDLDSLQQCVQGWMV